MNKILVSRCLIGACCRYDGGSNLVPWIKALYERGLAVPVCPEELGGLPTPRTPSERRGERVINQKGEDVTEQFCRGAGMALAVCREAGCTLAVLKARSPSCGRGEIYDGSFTHTRIPGNGVFADLLLSEGIQVLTEAEAKPEAL